MGYFLSTSALKREKRINYLKSISPMKDNSSAEHQTQQNTSTNKRQNKRAKVFGGIQVSEMTKLEYKSNKSDNNSDSDVGREDE